MGRRFELYVDADIANDIVHISQQFNVETQIIGYCEASDEKKVTVYNKEGEVLYQQE